MSPHHLGNFCPLQGSFGPFGPKVANRVRKWVPGPSQPRGPKSPKQSRKRVKIDYFSTILTLFRLSFGLFGPWGREGPGTHFRTLFATFGPKGPNDPCRGQKFSQHTILLIRQRIRRDQRTQRFIFKNSVGWGLPREGEGSKKPSKPTVIVRISSGIVPGYPGPLGVFGSESFLVRLKVFFLPKGAFSTCFPLGVCMAAMVLRKLNKAKTPFGQARSLAKEVCAHLAAPIEGRNALVQRARPPSNAPLARVLHQCAGGRNKQFLAIPVQSPQLHAHCSLAGLHCVGQHWRQRSPVDAGLMALCCSVVLVGHGGSTSSLEMGRSGWRGVISHSSMCHDQKIRGRSVG